MEIKNNNMEIKRTFDLLENLFLNHQKKDALVGKSEGEWKYHSTEDYYQNAHYVSYGLSELGISKGDKIITVSNNRPEWNFTDMGISQIGAIHIPVYQTISEEEYVHILTHSDAKLIIVSDKILFDKINPLLAKAPNIKEIYTYNNIDGAKNFSEIIQLGKENEEKWKTKIKNIKESILPSDTVSIIYTSGTTGLSKGVMLSHNNFISNVKGASVCTNLVPTDKTLSFLPLSHVLERMVNYTYQYIGVSIYYAENLGTIGDDLRRFKVHGFVTVPRVLETIYDKIVSAGNDLSGIKKKIFFWALNLANKFSYEKRDNNAWYRFQLKYADKLVFSKWRLAIGGNIKMILVGGSALQIRLARIFIAAGINIQEGYGLTESSPVVSVNKYTEKDNMIGTVGPILDGVKVKIAEDGEILVKGPNVMQGYYKSPEQTAEVIDEDNWLHTGDIGTLVDGKFLKITDRKKEIFKNSAGKYIAPQVIENKLKESNLIDQVMVVGDGEKFTSALISPNFNYLHFWAAKHKVHYKNNKELINDPKVIQKYQKEVQLYNKQLGQVEQIKRSRLVCESWTSATGELSPTLKLKRRVLYKRYDHILREIFQYEENEKNRAVKS